MLPGSESDASELRNPPPDPSAREGKDSAFTRDAKDVREAVRKEMGSTLLLSSFILT